MGIKKQNKNGDFEVEVPLRGKPISALGLSKGDKVAGPDGSGMRLLTDPVQEGGSAVFTVRPLPNLRVVRTQGLHGMDGREDS